MSRLFLRLMLEDVQKNNVLFYWPFVFVLMGLGFLLPWWLADKFWSVPNIEGEPPPRTRPGIAKER
jgi:hypothetical protein